MEERLKQYNEIKAEISKLKWKIKVLENEEIQPATACMEITGIKPKGYMQSSIENKIAKKNDEIRMHERQIEELQLEIDMIDSTVNILKQFQQNVIKSYYFDKKSVTIIAKEVDREEKTIFRILKNSMEKMNFIYLKEV